MGPNPTHTGLVGFGPIQWPDVHDVSVELDDSNRLIVRAVDSNDNAYRRVTFYRARRWHFRSALTGSLGEPPSDRSWWVRLPRVELAVEARFAEVTEVPSDRNVGRYAERSMTFGAAIEILEQAGTEFNDEQLSADHVDNNALVRELCRLASGRMEVVGLRARERIAALARDYGVPPEFWQGLVSDRISGYAEPGIAWMSGVMPKRGNASGVDALLFGSRQEAETGCRVSSEWLDRRRYIGPIEIWQRMEDYLWRHDVLDDPPFVP